MGGEMMEEILNMHEMQKELLPQLRFRLYLINVESMPTNEEPLKQYPASGYELLHMRGTK